MSDPVRFTVSSSHCHTSTTTTTSSTSTSSSTVIVGPMLGSLTEAQARISSLPSAGPTQEAKQSRPVAISASGNPLRIVFEGNASTTSPLQSSFLATQSANEAFVRACQADDHETARQAAIDQIKALQAFMAKSLCVSPPSHPSERDIMVARWNGLSAQAAAPLITAFDQALAAESAFDAVNFEGSDPKIILQHADQAIDAYNVLNHLFHTFGQAVKRGSDPHNRDLTYFRLKMLEVGAKAIKSTSMPLSKDVKYLLSPIRESMYIYNAGTNIFFDDKTGSIQYRPLSDHADTPIELFDILQIVRITNASKVIFPNEDIPLHTRDGLTRLGYIYGNASEADSLKPRLDQSIPGNLATLPPKDMELIFTNIDSFCQNFDELEAYSSNRANLNHLVAYLKSIGEPAFTALAHNLQTTGINTDIMQIILSYVSLFAALRLAKPLPLPEAKGV